MRVRVRVRVRVGLGLVGSIRAGPYNRLCRLPLGYCTESGPPQGGSPSSGAAPHCPTRAPEARRMATATLAAGCRRVALPQGKLGVKFRAGTTSVSVVRDDSPMAGVLAAGDRVAVLVAAQGDVDCRRMEGAELVELLRASAEESDREAIVTTSPRGCPVLVPAGAPPGGRWQAVAYVGQETLCYSFWCGFFSGFGCCACCCPEPRMWRDFRFVYVAEGKQWTEGGPVTNPRAWTCGASDPLAKAAARGFRQGRPELYI